MSCKSYKCAGLRHLSCSLYVAYALLQNALTVFKYTIRLFVLTEEGKQRRCLLALHMIWSHLPARLRDRVVSIWFGN